MNELKATQTPSMMLREHQDKRKSLEYVVDSFGIKESVAHLRDLSREVTKQELTTDTVHAACHCVGKINETIRTVIEASKYIASSRK